MIPRGAYLCTVMFARGLIVNRFVVCLTLGSLALAGCSDARRTLGLDRAPPDEYTVVARAPLSVPPEFGLKPPRPGAARPQEASTRQQAANTVFGGSTASRMLAGSASPGEATLLTQAGADKTPADIRATIDRETQALVVADRRWVDSLIFWQKQEAPYTVVNPQEEARRLRENAAQGKPVTDGNTPTVERKRKAPLEGLFN